MISEFVINSIKSEERNLSKLNLLDLFCGRGTISVPLCAMGAKIDAVDFDNSALESLRLGLRDYTINIKKRDLIYKPLLYTELMNYDYIILNPPRKGASEQIREIVKAAQMGANFKKIIYISCSKKSFKEDVNILTKNEGFRVTALKILDQFKWTEHVEILSEISV
ncbi:MAG: hypothetical protein EB127_07960 [Alphaproteobacteria bacterium]|nr:hypothetical protein [Alphaproteobacteria bacterium]